MAKQTLPSDLITDHALVRYLERIKGLDLNAVKNEMVDLDTPDMVEFMGKGKILTRRGHTLVVNNHKIVTVYK